MSRRWRWSSARGIGDSEPRSELPWEDGGVGIEASAADRSVIDACRPLTMVSDARLWALISAVDYVVRAGVPGAFVEAGVWRGGCALAMAMALRDRGCLDREIWLYDTFDGMTAPTAQDVERHSRRTAADLLGARDASNHYWAIAPRESVTTALASSGWPAESTHIVEGDVLQTLPGRAPERIALLRLDTDWYESTRWELECLYDRIEPGGVLIIDDYGHFEGARRAVDEFFAQRGQVVLMHRTDYTGRVILKR